MSAAAVLRRERAALCDTFETVGPDAPTLNEGWLAADLAAHLLVRETRPDAALGILLPGPFAKYTERVMQHYEARGFDAMVTALRGGPPWLHRQGPLARANVVENWIHHEDLRRPRGDGPRDLDEETTAILWDSLRLSSIVAGRRLHGAGLTLAAPADDRMRVVRHAEPMVTVTGPVGEIVLFMSGRKEAADVVLDGPPEGIAIVRAARFGL